MMMSMMMMKRVATAFVINSIDKLVHVNHRVAFKSVRWRAFGPDDDADQSELIKFQGYFWWATDGEAEQNWQMSHPKVEWNAWNPSNQKWMTQIFEFFSSFELNHLQLNKILFNLIGYVATFEHDLTRLSQNSCI